MKLSPGAVQEIESAYLWIRRHSPRGAERWYEQMEEALFSLAFHPHRFPLALETSFFSVELRQMVVGKKRHAYRVLYTVEGKSVRIHRVRHGAQDLLSSEDLQELRLRMMIRE